MRGRRRRLQRRLGHLRQNTAEKPRTTFSVCTGQVDVGVLKGKTVRLSLRDELLKYQMIEDGLRIVGDLNTEKVIEKDDNATVYVLNPNAEDSKQIRFVASTSGGKPELLLIVHNDQGPGTVDQGRPSLSQ